MMARWKTRLVVSRGRMSLYLLLLLGSREERVNFNGAGAKMDRVPVPVLLSIKKINHQSIYIHHVYVYIWG